MAAGYFFRKIQKKALLEAITLAIGLGFMKLNQMILAIFPNEYYFYSSFEKWLNKTSPYKPSTPLDLI